MVSATIKCICGIIRPSKGSILFKGAAIRALSSFKIANMGIGLVPEGRRIFSNLTLYENLLSAQKKGYWDLSKILDLFPVFKERLNQMSLTLSGGEQQMLAVSRALMSRPQLLLMDEPSLGLAPQIVEDLFPRFITINKEHGTKMLIVEQNAQLALDIASRAYVLESGEITIEGKASELADDDAIRRAYLGA